MSSPYCVTWNKGVRLLSVLGLWPIVETSVVSENDGTTVRQTVAHTIQLWPHGLVRHMVHAFRGERHTINNCEQVTNPRLRMASPHMACNKFYVQYNGNCLTYNFHYKKPSVYAWERTFRFLTFLDIEVVLSRWNFWFAPNSEVVCNTILIKNPYFT